MVTLCPHCSATNASKAKFCRECGSSLLATMVAEAATVEGEEVPASGGKNDLESVYENSRPSTARGPTSSAASAQGSCCGNTAEKSVREDALPSGTASLAPTNTQNEVPLALNDEPETTTSALSIQTDELPVALLLEVSFGRVMVCGCSSVFHFRLINRSPGAIQDVVVRFECEAFEKDSRLRFSSMSAGRMVERPIEASIRPERAGHSLLRCTVEFGSGGQQYCYVGQRPIDILARPADLSNVSVSIGDILSNRDGGVGDNERAVVSNLVDLSRIKTLNDLLAITLPEQFTAIPLEMDYEVSYRSIATKKRVEEQGLQLAERSTRKTALLRPATVLHLIPLTGDPESFISLVSRAVFRLGRSRAEADYPTRFWPRSTENDARTMRLSRIHALCEIADSTLVVKDNGTVTGTRYENAAVGTEGLPLRDRGRLDLGGDFSLCVTRFPADFDPATCIGNAEAWPGPSVPPLPVGGAVRFDAPCCQDAENVFPPWRVLWLLSDATFGTSNANPLPIEDPQLSEIQGRFVHWQGCFWLQSLCPNSAIAVDGMILPTGTLLPLFDHQRLALGTRVFTVELLPKPESSKENK